MSLRHHVKSHHGFVELGHLHVGTPLLHQLVLHIHHRHHHVHHHLEHLGVLHHLHVLLHHLHDVLIVHSLLLLQFLELLSGEMHSQVTLLVAEELHDLRDSLILCQCLACHFSILETDIPELSVQVLVFGIGLSRDLEDTTGYIPEFTEQSLEFVHSDICK